MDNSDRDWRNSTAISTSSRSSESARPLMNISKFPASSISREAPITSKQSGLVDGSMSDTKIAKAVAACQESMSELALLRRIKDCVEEAAAGSVLSSTTAEKLNGILRVHNASKYLRLPSTNKDHPEDFTLLGIVNLPKYSLTHEEKREIKDVVENLFREKMDKIKTSDEKMRGTVKEDPKTKDSMMAYLEETPHDDLLRWKDNIDDLCKDYYRDVIKSADLMYQWQQLKYIDAKEINTLNAEHLLLESQVAETQAEIAKKTCALKMFKEIPGSAEAFKNLNDNLDERLRDGREQLRVKRALDIAYEEAASNPEYAEMLKKYKDLKVAVKKKELLLEKL